MIVNDRITDYIQSLETSQGPVLDEIEKEALDQFVPIIRKETAAFLRTMTAALKPSAILEIGRRVFCFADVPGDAGALPHYYH